MLAPEFIHPDYDTSHFKLFCDDLGLANLMVRSREDLTVVGVVDLEWSYVGPAQLLASAPWWLLMERPTNPAWDCDEREPIDLTNRYTGYLEMYKRLLKDAEAKMPGCENHEFERSGSSGAMWIYMLLVTGFNNTITWPFTKLIQHVGIERWNDLEDEVDKFEVVRFGTKKKHQLEQYERDLEKSRRRRSI